MAFYGNGALNRTLRYIESSFKHDYKITRNLEETCTNPCIAWCVVWLFYVIKVIIYVLHIIPDLLTGHKFWTPEIRIEDMKHNEITELLRRSEPRIKPPVHNPRPQISQSSPTYSCNSDKQEAETFILNILRANRGILKGVIVNTQERKIREDELVQFTTLGRLSSPAMKQYISFGNEINEKLHKALGQIPECAFVKRKQGTCFVLNDGNYTPIVDKLIILTGQPNIQINLTGC